MSDLDAFLKVISAAWDPETARLYTGDETGRLRCWCLRAVLEALGAEPVGGAATAGGDTDQVKSADDKGRWSGGAGERTGEARQSGTQVRRALVKGYPKHAEHIARQHRWSGCADEV